MATSRVINRGRTTQFINGITGVSPGGNGIVNMDVNKRYHRNTLQTSAVNYTGGTAQATLKLTGAGNNNATVTPTIVNGVVTSVAVVAGGTGYVTGDTITIVDATGTGLVLTVTAAAGAITALVVTAVGTPSATNPATVISFLKQIVNGIVMRDIGVDRLLRIIRFNSPSDLSDSRLGELPLLYTERFFDINQLNEILSWDLFGQSTFTLQPGVNSLVTNPGIIGVMEFDYERNVRPVAGGLTPFLQPVAHHEYTLNVVGGLNLINTVPFDYPIRRLYFIGSTPGNITQLEILQDGNKVYEATVAQNEQQLSEQGFQAGQRNFLTEMSAGNTGVAGVPFNLAGNYNPQSFLQRPFDMTYVTDVDRRIQKALTCENSLVLRVTSAIAQSITIVAEYLPGSYAS